MGYFSDSGYVKPDTGRKETVTYSPDEERAELFGSDGSLIAVAVTRSADCGDGGVERLTHAGFFGKEFPLRYSADELSKWTASHGFEKSEAVEYDEKGDIFTIEICEKKEYESGIPYDDVAEFSQAGDDVILVHKEVTDNFSLTVESAVIEDDNLNSRPYTDRIDLEKIGFRKNMEMAEEQLAGETGNVRLFITDGPFTAASFYSPESGETVPATVTFNTRSNTITIAFCDGGSPEKSAGKIMEKISGMAAGTGDGIAESPRGMEMTEKNLIDAFMAAEEAVFPAKSTERTEELADIRGWVCSVIRENQQERGFSLPGSGGGEGHTTEDIDH